MKSLENDLLYYDRIEILLKILKKHKSVTMTNINNVRLTIEKEDGRITVFSHPPTVKGSYDYNIDSFLKMMIKINELQICDRCEEPSLTQTCETCEFEQFAIEISKKGTECPICGFTESELSKCICCKNSICKRCFYRLDICPMCRYPYDQ